MKRSPGSQKQTNNETTIQKPQEYILSAAAFI